MASVGRIPLEGGGEVLFETVGESDAAGPVKAGRVGDAMRDLPRTLQEALAPVRELAGAVVTQLREAGPAEVEVEFGVDLSAQVGVVVSKGEATAHLRVRVLWQRGPGDGNGV
ncbi:CU044_2847 family protein [Streptomyces sedi]|uniref:Trypsin-co-occurring domain-containing protein n=1 Tax=Streptomyces sedi TaxID=555059 RepID=A0A5C4UR71_9ACTN|nr:CU044_2847 family protein [Streptomyces sedi]TNM25955.1 hypothetical protein FH715_25325 [Streptomyces sedi]